jgi:hypothetical protein
MRPKLFLNAATALAAAFALTVPAGAGCGEPCGEVDSRGANVQLSILIEGRPTIVYRDGPYRWIEGRSGQRFAFQVVNRNAFPVAVIPSADGQSLTSDGRAGANDPAYIIDPFGSLNVSVWREDLQGGRELVFTDVARSLAARKGDRRNVGVLGLCVWQLAEREAPRPLPIDPGRGRAHGERDGRPAAPSDIVRQPDTPGIGVGAGGRVTDRAYLTDRYRRVRVLDTIAVYYDDREGLVRAGVDLGQYRRLYPDRRGADPFPEGGYRGVRIPD